MWVVPLVASIGLAAAFVWKWGGSLQIVVLVAMCICITITICWLIVQFYFTEKLHEKEELLGQLTQGVVPLNQEIGKLQSSVEALATRAPMVSSVLSELRNVESSQIEQFARGHCERLEKAMEGLSATLWAKSFTIVWNSLPYSQYFDKFSDRDKVLYFDAITSGNWSRIHSRIRDMKREVDHGT